MSRVESDSQGNQSPPVEALEPLAHASAAAEAVRALNHATLVGAGYRCPQDVSAVLGELQLTAYRLAQVVERAERWLRRAHARGEIEAANGGSVPVALITTTAALQRAQQHAAALGVCLDNAHLHTQRLTGPNTITTPSTGTNVGEEQ